MSYQPDIIPSSTTGQELQAAIQKELAFRGWSTEDDTVMAEYCLVMLGNRKTPDQISTELSDLIGGDFEPSFVSWLFSELLVHYPDPNAAPPSANNSSNNNNEYGSIRGVASTRRTSGPGGTAVFGQAMSGVKRERDEPDSRSQRTKFDRSAQFEGVPAGPRNPNANGAGNGGRAAGNRNQGGGDKSIFDRVQQGGNQGMMQQSGFDNIQGTIDAVTRGATSFGAAQGHPQAGFMDPRMLAQAQAMAQAFAAMQGQQMAAWNQQQQQNYGQPGFNPAFQSPGGFPGFPVAPPRQGHPNFQQQQQQQFPYQQSRQQQSHFPPPPTAAAPLPTKPTDPEICKHGVDCSKPACPFSHPSPVATKYSGLVLSSEACEKMLDCEDLDCAKSHVSASQKRAPTPSPYTSTPSTRAPPVADPYSIPGAGEKVCKFAAACTRKGCVFLHPWDVRDSNSSGGVVCRWAENCTRADCHYSHPPNRANVYTKPKAAPYSTSYTKPKPSSYSAVFNNPNNPAIGAWPTEQKDHVSDRLKRFNVVPEAGGEGEVERIIPGGSNGNVKVEIELEGPVSDAPEVAAVVAVTESMPKEVKVEVVAAST